MDERFKKFNDTELFFFTYILTEARMNKTDKAYVSVIKEKLGGKMKGSLDVGEMLEEVMEEISRKERS